MVPTKNFFGLRRIPLRLKKGRSSVLPATGAPGFRAARTFQPSQRRSRPYLIPAVSFIAAALAAAVLPGFLRYLDLWPSQALAPPDSRRPNTMASEPATVVAQPSQSAIDPTRTAADTSTPTPSPQSPAASSYPSPGTSASPTEPSLSYEPVSTPLVSNAMPPRSPQTTAMPIAAPAATPPTVVDSHRLAQRRDAEVHDPDANPSSQHARARDSYGKPRPYSYENARYPTDLALPTTPPAQTLNRSVDETPPIGITDPSLFFAPRRVLAPKGVPEVAPASPPWPPFHRLPPEVTAAGLE